MKRLILFLGICFSLVPLTMARNNVLFIRIGGSQFSGVVGAEFQHGHFGIEGGWGGFNHSSFDEPWNMGAVALSVYSGKPFKNSFYGSIGYAFNGVIKLTIQDNEILNAEYANSTGFVVGFKWGGDTWFSLKGGVGDQLSEIKNSFTGEFTIGIAFIYF